MPTDAEDWEISIFVPGGATAPVPIPPDPATQDHAKLPAWLGGSRIEKVKSDVIKQWEATLGGLLQMSSVVGAHSRDWVAEEIEVGFTLSAKGELLFIAEAGGEASITVKLKRRA